MSKQHPYDKIDRASRAALARATGGVSPHSIMETWLDWSLHLSRSPGRQLELFDRMTSNYMKLFQYSVSLAADKHAEPPFQPRKEDHRFVSDDWSQLPFALYQQSFLSLQDWWQLATDEMPGIAPRDTDRAQFQIRQALDLISPFNFFVTNPEIMRCTFEKSGTNLSEGATLFLQDALHTFLQDHQEPPEGFKVGKDIACTPGRVIFKNDLFELIQYLPTTKQVKAEPVLFVPAWIMKYYVLDLSPHNSMVRYLVSQGYTVFMMSWVNPSVEQSDLGLDDYRKQGIMTAIDKINEVIPNAKIHINGYCLGGTLLAITAAEMSRRNDDRLASVTLMAAQVDFAEAGELSLFIDDSQVAFVEDLMWTQGYLDRPQMARTFTTIRSEDLIYARAVRRYFLGEDDLPTDLMVWNNDTTRMPARMHSEYLRGLFLENRLSAGRFAVEGSVVALKDIRYPLFIVGTETDHIAPWRSVYKIRLFTDGDLTFVLTNGGHNSAIISEPGHKHRHYRLGHRPADALYVAPDKWLEQTQTTEGSWWPAMVNWLNEHSSKSVVPPAIGKKSRLSKKAEKLSKAPGEYIHMV